MEKLATLRTQRQELRAERKQGSTAHLHRHVAAEGGGGGQRRGGRRSPQAALVEWLRGRREKQLQHDIVQTETLLSGLTEEDPNPSPDPNLNPNTLTP